MVGTVILLFKNTGLFSRLECQLRKKWNIKCREFQTNLFAVIGNAKLRPSFVIC